jgi:tripartite ATP-independent transporter DctM subunit
MALSMTVAMCVLFALAIPVSVAILASSVLGIVGYTPFPLRLVAQQLFAALDKFPLAAVPFFILAGNLMEAGGISQRLVDFAKALVGGVRGGLAVSCVLTCMIFAAVSGSSVATTFAVGAILIPTLARHGYPLPWAGALQASSAELGVIIPPSIPMILYGISTDTSIGEMFIAGIGPGLLIGAALAAYVLVWCRVTGHGANDGADRLPVGLAARRAVLALMMPVIILGGIYGGVFTPTEASVVAVVYAMAVGMLVYRRIDLRTLRVQFEKSVVASTVIMLLIAAAGLFSFLINRAGVPIAVGDWISAHLHDRLTFLLAVNAFLFVIGMFIETAASIVILGPILLPVAVGFGIDPVHFGLIMVVNLALGMVTPPFGVNLFAAATVARISVDRLVGPLVGFVTVVILCLMAITYVPGISLALRDVVYR